MILQRLAEHYDRIVAEGKAELAPPGKSVQKVSFCIVLHPDGTLHSFADERVQEGKRMRPASLVVPGQGKPSGSGLNPRFLWDNAEYLLGWSADPEKKRRAPLAFANFRDKHLQAEAAVHQPVFTAVCNFLRKWKPEDAEQYASVLEERATNFGVFRIVGEQCYVHDRVLEPLSTEQQEEAVAAHCLVSGEYAPVARLHEPKIKGVSGAQTAGALLVSFNATAFASYGKDQSYNAPVSEGVVFRYANALNHLLNTRNMRLGDTTFTYWADHSTFIEEAFGLIFTGEKDDSPEIIEDAMRVAEAKLLLSQLRDGTQTVKAAEAAPDTRFFILGLSPNASRLSVRVWIEADAGEMLERLRRHVEDFALRGGRDDLPPPLWLVAAATGRSEHDAKGRFKSYDTDSVSPHLAGELARSVLMGAPYPQSLLATMIRRIQADGEISYVRVCAIKGCLIRNTRHTSKPLEIPVELDTDATDVAYRCGRLFAILEKAQSDSAGGELNATIKDRYFSAASATPALVFPRLFRLNTHHLNKLPIGTKIWYEQLIGAAMAAPFAFPHQLSLLQQGRFIVGYFQQRQDLYTKKKEQNTEEAA